MGFQISPGVAVSEIDLTTVIPSVATTTGGFAGNFSWGPVEQRVLVEDEDKLVEMFHKPDANSATSFFTAANFLAYTNALFVVRSANTAAAKNATATGGGLLIKNKEHYEDNYADGSATEGNWAARYPGAIGNGLKVSICSGSEAFSANLTADFSANVVSTDFANSPLMLTFNKDLSANLVIGDYVKCGTEGYLKIANIGTTTANLATAPSAAIPASSILLRKWEFADSFLSAPGTSDFAVAKGAANDELHVVVVDTRGVFTGVPNEILEKYQFLSKASDAKYDSGTSQYYVNNINSNSNYIYWIDHSTSGTNWGNVSSNGVNSTTYTSNRKGETNTLSGGVDAAPTLANLETSYDFFNNPDAIDVSLLLTGDAGGGDSSSQGTLVTYLINSIAEVRKDCVVFFSPTKDMVVQNRNSEATDIQSYRDILPSSSYAFMDSGWKYQLDKYNDVYRWVPLNGDIAGLAARTDHDRDPWFSIAGFNRGNIKNVTKLAWVPEKAERDELYKKGVNSVVSFAGEGTVLYGDKTLLAKPSSFDRINVRRLFIVLEKSIAKAAKYSLFEFNDEFTRSQFVALVDPYLRLVQGRRGITDYRVVCDETNNTAEVIDRNEFVGDIYVKPAKSINYIQLNFVAVRSGVAFDEIVGKW